jgi:hypothetical protein
MRDTVLRFLSLWIVIEFCPENLSNGGYSSEDFYSMLTSMNLFIEIIQKDGSTVIVSSFNDLMSKLGDEVYCNLLCRLGDKHL